MVALRGWGMGSGPLANLGNDTRCLQRFTSRRPCLVCHAGGVGRDTTARTAPSLPVPGLRRVVSPATRRARSTNDGRELPMRIAVVGSGVAGLGAAWALSRTHDVTVFEAGTYLGGHAHTVEIGDGDRSVPVDTGFIVYNEANYPNLVRLFRDARGRRPSPATCRSPFRGTGAPSSTRRARSGSSPSPRTSPGPAYRRMVREIFRFAKEAKAPRRHRRPRVDRRVARPSRLLPRAPRGLRAAHDRLHLVVEPRRHGLVPGRHDGRVPEQPRPARRAAPPGVAHGVGRQP